MTRNNVEQTVAQSDPSSLVPVERARQSKLSYGLLWFYHVKINRDVFPAYMLYIG